MGPRMKQFFREARRETPKTAIEVTPAKHGYFDDSGWVDPVRATYRLGKSEEDIFDNAMKNARQFYRGKPARERIERSTDRIKREADAEARTMEQAFKERARDRSKAARQTMRRPLQAAVPIPNMRPLQKVTGVALNPSLAGANAASAEFYVNPESVASRYEITPSPGSGGIGVRQRATTAGIEPTKDTLGKKRRDEF